MNVFKKMQASLRLKEAVRKANEAFEETGERHYVMPMEGGKLLIVDRSNFRELKQKGYINRLVTVATLESECFYATPYRNGSKEMSPEEIKERRKGYYKYLNKKK